MSTTTPEVQTKPSPAAAPTAAKAAVQATRQRIPMSVPMQKMQVPELPGYYLHWFREENVPRAAQAGYEMVKRDEVSLNPLDVGSSRSVDGNTDLGSNVTFVSGTNEHGQPQRAVLMKLKQEFRDEDQKLADERNARILRAIFAGEAVGKPGDPVPGSEEGTTYIKQALFNRPTRKVKKIVKPGF